MELTQMAHMTFPTKNNPINVEQLTKSVSLGLALRQAGPLQQCAILTQTPSSILEDLMISKMFFEFIMFPTILKSRYPTHPESESVN